MVEASGGSSGTVAEVRTEPVELMRLFAGRPTDITGRWRVEGDPQAALALAASRLIF
jgi:hypothetical protein